ncbi:MAG: GNAT family N-acetyltransferase [Luteibaculaceae bacterium]
MRLANNLVQLRAMEPTDLPYLFSWENDTLHWQVSETKFPFSKHLLEKFIESGTNLEQDGQLRFIIALSNNEPIGTLDLFEYDAVNQRAGVGLLIDLKYRGEGYGKLALDLAIDYAFKVLHLVQLHASILSDNQVSTNLFKACDFMPCGYRQKWVKSPEGIWLDEQLFQLFNPKSL